MNIRLIGETTAKMMDAFEEAGDKFADSEILAVGIVCVIADDDSTFTRVFCSEDIHYRQLGLFTSAVDVCNGTLIPEGEDD